MNYQKLLYKYMQKNNIRIKTVSDLTGIRYELLRRSLTEKRVLPESEFVLILKKLNIGIEDLENEFEVLKPLQDYVKIIVETDESDPVTIAEIKAEEINVSEGYRVRLTPIYS